jgi:hypothetical protein
MAKSVARNISIRTGDYERSIIPSLSDRSEFPRATVVRFTKIGFSHPYFTAHFVGAFETAKNFPIGYLRLPCLSTRGGEVHLRRRCVSTPLP